MRLTVSTGILLAAVATASLLALAPVLTPPLTSGPAHVAAISPWSARQGPAAGLAGFGAGLFTTTLLRSRRSLTAAAAAGLGALAPLMFAVAALAQDGHHSGEAVQENRGTEEAAVRDPAYRLPDGAVVIPKPTQRILSIRTTVIEPTTHRRSVELPGRIIPDPNASGYVQAAVSGRLSPPPNGFPRLGTRVEAGDVLAYATPPFTAAESSNQRQRQGELDQQIEILERRLARYETLDKTGAISRTKLEDLRTELESLKDRRAALDQIRHVPEPLVAPVSGVVAAANAVAGQIANANAVVFQIVDPAKLWIEALSFETLAGAHGARARFAGGLSRPLSYQGSGFADRNQAIPVHFQIEGDTKGLRPGQLVTVQVETEEAREGLAVPRTSVLRGPNGQAVVYEHASAERFEAREVRVVPLDGERLLIAAGLEPGRRVVTQGAELLNQIR
jgi:cobalt-zinc-cadmium efflux system membrane fusion protein